MTALIAHCRNALQLRETFSGIAGEASGGTGDILTGTLAGLLAQFPKRTDIAMPPQAPFQR